MVVQAAVVQIDGAHHRLPAVADKHLGMDKARGVLAYPDAGVQQRGVMGQVPPGDAGKRPAGEVAGKADGICAENHRAAAVVHTNTRLLVQKEAASSAARCRTVCYPSLTLLSFYRDRISVF